MCAWLKTQGGRENMQTSASKERRGWEDPLVAQHHELPGNLVYTRSIHVWLERFRDHRLLRELLWIPHGSSNQQCCPQGPEPETGGNPLGYIRIMSWVLMTYPPPHRGTLSCRNQWQHRPPPIAQLWFTVGKEGRFNSHTLTLPVRRSFLSHSPRVVKK